MRKIWITGASSGIGKALAIKFANEGWKVAASARRENLLKELNYKYPNIHPFPLDVTDSDKCRSVFKDIIESGYVTTKKAYCLLEGESRPHKSNKRRFRRWKLVGFVNIIFTKENLSPFHNRFLSKLEMERLQTVPENYTKPLTRNQAASVLGDGWTIDVICHILQRIKNEP